MAMNKAERDEVGRLLLVEISEDERTGPDDIEFAFLSFLATKQPLDDMLPWMLGFLGYGQEYLNRTGAIETLNP